VIAITTNAATNVWRARIVSIRDQRRRGPIGR
jgi:hypothetical protein